MRRQLAFETLEPRQVLSGSSLSHFLVVDAASFSQAQASSSPTVSTTVADGTPSLRQFLGSTAKLSASTRWDWLSQTVWYVPQENLLAYSTSQQLTDPTPIGDQTLWFMNQSSGGQIAGEAVTKLSINPVPTHMSFTGVVTPDGQIRIEFATGSTPTTGIGQMRFVQGAWRMEMQMATAGEPLVAHWAYMSEQSPGTVPPEPSDLPADPGLLSNEWSWIEGTHWAIVDSALFGTAQAGVFQIDAYRNGYFWGSGTSTQPFNVFGSVTPEGNLLLLVSVPNSSAAVRTGTLQQTSSGGMMTLRTYEGQPAVGSAWTIADPAAPIPGPVTPSMRALLAATLRTSH
jgi:hypothetical protein